MKTEDIPPRRVVVVRHDGPEDTVDETRRPLYQELIMQEAVGGPSMLRFPDGPDGQPEVLVEASPGFLGGVYQVQILDEGVYAVEDYEGPVDGIQAARIDFLQRVQDSHAETGPLVQVHMMDAIEGETEQQFQVLLRPSL